MKTFVLVLALLAVALAAPADDNNNNNKKPEKIREKGNTEYDAVLKFNWKGDNSWKSQFESAFKPVADFLNALGFKGSLNSDTNGQGGGDVSGHFRLSGKRGNGAKVSEASDNPAESSGNDANTEVSSSSVSSKSGPSGFSIPQVSNLSGGKLGRGILPQFG